MSDGNNVLLVGGKTSCLRFIRHISSNEAISAQQESNSEDHLLSLSNGWTLENKYYRAHLDIFTMDGASHGASSLLDDRTWSALIYVFDADDGESQANQLQYWNPWLPVAERISPDIHLCVSVSTDESCSLNEQRVGLWDDWCMENGIEFVNLILNEEAQVPQQSQRLLGDDDEEDARPGVQVIADSMHANMWSQMTMLNRGDATGVKPPPEVAAEGYVEFGEFQQAQEGQNIFDKTAMGMEALFSGGVSNESNFEEVLSNVAEMRDHIATLPDAERREMAAKFAIYVASMMDAVGEEEEM